MVLKNDKAISANEKYLKNILKGNLGGFGKGNKTVFSGGKKFNIHSHTGRRDAYIAVCEQEGIEVDYKILADSALENKYLSKNKKRQDEVLGEVIYAGSSKGADYWRDYLYSSEHREVGEISELESKVGLSRVKNIEKEKRSMFSFSKLGKYAVVASVLAASVFAPLSIGSGDLARGAETNLNQKTTEVKVMVDSSDYEKERAEVFANLSECNGSVEYNIAPRKNCNVSVSEQRAGYSIYTVKKGDTMSEIAVKYKIGLEDFVKLNSGIKNRDWIFPGDRIYVPSVAGVPKNKTINSNNENVDSGKNGADNPALENKYLSKNKKKQDEVLGDAGKAVLEKGRKRDTKSLERTVEKGVDEGKKESGWSSYYYENMKRESPVLDMNGRADPSSERFSTAIQKNYAPLVKELSGGNNIGYGEEKAESRIKSIGKRFSDAGKNILNFITLGNLYEPFHLKKLRDNGNPANRFLTAIGAPVRIIKNDVLGLVGDIADIPTGGTVSKVGRTLGGLALGTVGTCLDSASAIVGGVSAYTIQPIEESIYGKSYLSKVANGAFGISTRFLENVVNLEAMDNGDLSKDGHKKGFIGSLAEQLFTYGIIGGIADKDEDSSDSGNTGSEGGVIVEDPGNWRTVGR